MSQSGEKSKLSTSASDRKSGRAVFDEGRTVWEWQTATGVFQRQVSDEQLARLENAGLQLVEQASDTGRAIYNADQTGSQKAYGKQVFVGRPTPVVRTAPAGTLRQFWRRLLPST
jgi:hypothetical protein